MSLSISNLKQLLQENIAPLFYNEGFTFNKSEFTFNKKVGRNKVTCIFLFYNFAPLRVEFHFSFQFTIDEIEKERKKFLEQGGDQYKRVYTFSLREGDFHPNVKNDTLKLRAAFTHILTDLEQFQPLEDCKTVLKTEFFPRLSTFCNLAEFQDFVLMNRDKILHLGIVWPALFALKLKGNHEFNELMKFVKSELKIDEQLAISHEKQMIESLIKWQKNELMIK